MYVADTWMSTVAKKHGFIIISLDKLRIHGWGTLLNIMYLQCKLRGKEAATDR